MDLSLVSAAFDRDATVLLRTDFADDAAWRTVVELVTRPVDLEDPDGGAPVDPDDGYEAHVAPIEDPALAGVTGPALGDAATASSGLNGYALLADARAMTEARAGGEVTLDYVDLSAFTVTDPELFNTFPGRTFRCTVTEVASIEANLAVANMDFHEFADHTDADGVFRGFED